MRTADLRERLAAASLLLSDPGLHAEAEAELFQYMARIVRARRNAMPIHSENPSASRVSVLDTRVEAVMREWEREPFISDAELRKRLNLTNGTAWRVLKRLRETGALVRSGHWWRLANSTGRDIRSQGEPSAVPPVKNLDDRAMRLLYEWQLSPLANLMDITNRLGVQRSSAQRLTAKLAGAGLLVKAGRWWKLAEPAIVDATFDAGASA